MHKEGRDKNTKWGERIHISSLYAMFKVQKDIDFAKNYLYNVSIDS